LKKDVTLSKSDVRKAHEIIMELLVLQKDRIKEELQEKIIFCWKGLALPVLEKVIHMSMKQNPEKIE